MSRHDDPAGVISWIEEKAAQLTGLPVSHGEVKISPSIHLQLLQVILIPLHGTLHQNALRAS